MKNPSRYRWVAPAAFVLSAVLGVVALLLLPSSISSESASGEAIASSAEEESLIAPSVSEDEAGRTTSAPFTTTTTSTTTTTTTTTPPRELSIAVGGESQPLSFAPYGWVLPAEEGGEAALGADLNALLDFVEPNDGPFGVSIDEAFLEANAGAPWLSVEDGMPVIDSIDATDRCLNILTPLTLRRSFVSCPTRVQSDLWGFAGEVDDAPAVNIGAGLSAGVIIEHNTITCTGFDGDICSRSVRVGSRGSIVRFNDLSFARGAVALFHDSTFVFNYLHDFAFGFDPTRANSETDRVTHNNSVNNLGYQNVLVAGNFIDATYGRVSLDPEEFTNPHFRDAYPAGVVAEGDHINGFAFTNYLVNGNGSGATYTRNYVRGVGRGFRCNSSAQHEDSVCADDFSFNVFDDLRIDLFNAEPVFEDKDGEGQLDISCNFELEGGDFSALTLAEESHGEQCEQRLELSSEAQAAFSSELARTPISAQ